MISTRFCHRGCLLLLAGLATCLASTPLRAVEYSPRFWVEGVADRLAIADSDNTAELEKLVSDIAGEGWRGLVFWGASRRGTAMDYMFKSPFLERQDWATSKRDGLTPLIKAAHPRGLKVMLNIEGVNPYHWKEHRWTSDTIKAVAGDLADSGVDAVFEECFEAKPEVFLSLARELARRGVNYLSGTDPMLLREPNFAALWPETGTINIYNYYLKRDKLFNIATLTQHGSLGFGWAKGWGKATALISPLNRNWGIATEFSPAVVRSLCLIRALQFRVDDFIIFGGRNLFDPLRTQTWIKEYVDRQEKDRPTLNIVVLLPQQQTYGSATRGDPGWNRLFNSGDAITSGAFNAGYNVVVSDKVLPADAHWIYASGGATDVLPPEVVALFNTAKPVFIQCGSAIPSGSGIDPGWKTTLAKCGVDAAAAFTYGAGARTDTGASLPPNQAEDLPYTGYYRNVYLRFTGSDAQRGTNLRAGTVIPAAAITGTVFSTPNKTYGKGPYIVGKDNKYVVAATCLNWEVAYPISHLLSGGGVLPSSNVWGIVGRNVTALLAIETTELEVKIPGLADGSPVRVVVWDRHGQRKFEENAIYRAPFKRILSEYDLILIDSRG